MLGVLANQTGHLKEAVELLKHATTLSPQDSDTWFNLATTLMQKGDLPDAELAYIRCLKQNPEKIEARVNLAVMLGDLGRHREAIQLLEDGIRRGLQNASLWQNLATMKKSLGHFDASIEDYRQALQLQPDNADIHFNLSGSLLTTGQFQKGWKEYRWRWRSQSFLASNPWRNPPIPVWQGEDIAGKKVLILKEQGIGDEVMFATCIPDVMSCTTDCCLECDPRLSELFSRSFPGLQTIRPAETEKVWNQYDIALFAGDMPALFRNCFSDFPKPSVHLKPDLARVEQIKNMLHARELNGKPKIGISWRGGRDKRVQTSRSIPLGEWRRLTESFDAFWINLQYGDHLAEIEHSNVPLITVPGIDPLQDIEGFCALLANLDQVISVDNSTVHFAGALNIPCLTILPIAHDWRWFTSTGNTTPWYDSVQLWRLSASQPDYPDLFLTLSKILRQRFS